MNERAAEVHFVMAGEDFLTGLCEVECSCGWEATGLATMADAQDAWENHCDEVKRLSPVRRRVRDLTDEERARWAEAAEEHRRGD